jgi:hypothetical protein
MGIMDQNLLQELQRDFTRLSRAERNRILCAMMRINYGTAWAGDRDLLNSFFPTAVHSFFILGGLSDWIAGLTPLSDEPTNPGIKRVQTPPEKELGNDLPYWMEITLTDLPARANSEE